VNTGTESMHRVMHRPLGQVAQGIGRVMHTTHRPYDDDGDQRGKGLRQNTNVKTLFLDAPLQRGSRASACARGLALAGDLAADTGERAQHARGRR
jgi:hypothetical protein